MIGNHSSPSLPITIDPDILGGTPVFCGTRVPVRICLTIRRWLFVGLVPGQFSNCSTDRCIAGSEFPDVTTLPRRSTNLQRE